MTLPARGVTTFGSQRQTTSAGELGMASELSEFATTLCMDDLPADVLRMLPSLIRDQLSCQVVGSSIPHNAVVRQYALVESPIGSSSVIRAVRRARPEWAALANATAGHGFEMDDTHARALAHPGCVVVPTLFAVGEDLDSSGERAMTALALGFEIVLRIGMATQPSMVEDRGFHETAVMGVFGAAAIAGLLHGLDADQLTNAFGIAGSHASGTIEYGQSGGEVKRLHAGLGALGGIRSANLAARGLTGPRLILEGKKGILQAVADRPSPSELLAGLGDKWHLTDLHAKRYAAAASIHGPVNALRSIMADNAVNHRDIVRIVVGVDSFSAKHLGSLGSDPTTFAEAQFSLRYSIGMAAVLGDNGHREYQAIAAAGFADEDVKRITGITTIEVDAESDADFPHELHGHVRVELSDGRTFAGRGATQLTWDYEYVEERFQDVLSEEYGDEVTVHVGQAIDELLNDGPVRAALAPLHSPS